MKSKRIIDKELIATYHDKPCEVCGAYYPVSAHHLKTVGSGGNDIDDNLLALCITHHTEVHQSGLNAFLFKYPHVKKTCADKGWAFDKFLEKWVG